MTQDEAEAICGRYEARKARAEPHEVVAYWEARAALERLGVRPMTAGQRGYWQAVQAHRQRRAGGEMEAA